MIKNKCIRKLLYLGFAVSMLMISYTAYAAQAEEVRLEIAGNPEDTETEKPSEEEPTAEESASEEESAAPEESEAETEEETSQEAEEEESSEADAKPEEPAAFITTGLKAANDNGFVSLKWDKTEGASGYIVYRKIGDGNLEFLSRTTDVSYLDKDAAIGEFNFYRVYPYAKAEDGSEIDGDSENYVYICPKPGTVMGLTAAYTGPTEVTLKWDAVPNATGYVIYRRIGNGSFSYLYLAPGNTFVDKGASVDEHNFYRVYAYRFDSAGSYVLGASGNYAFGVTPAVQNLKAAADSQRNIELSWSQVKGAAGYAVYEKRADQPSFVCIGETGDTTYLTKEHKPGELYYYRVYAYRMIGGKRVQSSSLNYVYTRAKDDEKHSGLVKIDGQYYYYLASGEFAKGLRTVDNKKYYFDETGAAVTGIREVDGAIYYFDVNEPSGTMLGMKLIDGQVYYFNQNTGRALVNYMATLNGKKYYFGAKGAAITGKQETYGFTYYFDISQADGVYRGFKEIDGKTYYFNTNYGEMVTSRMMVINDKRYYFDKDGSMATGFRYVENAAGGSYYFFDPNEPGGTKTGRQEYEGDDYYFHPTSGIQRFGFWSFGSDVCFYDWTSGKLVKNVTWTVEETGIEFTADENGVLSYKAASGHENDMRTTVLLKGLETLGLPYRVDDTGLVCSTQVAYAYDAAGFSGFVKKESFQQALLCYENGWTYDAASVKIDDVIKPGDLVFWRLRDGTCEDENCDHWQEIHHVAIYLGHGQMIEASQKWDILLIRNTEEDDDYFIIYYADVISHL